VAIDLAERYADEKATKEEMATVSHSLVTSTAGRLALRLSGREAARESSDFVCWFVHWHPGSSRFEKGREVSEQADLLAEIAGNPFQDIVLDRSWLTSTVIALSRQMYESQDFSAMPILADAMQDAGCDNADILSHCRGPGVHVRGCWVVDKLLTRV
jgi:hypothetical protein